MKIICPDADVAIVNALLDGGAFSDPPDTREDAEPDALDKFVESAALAGAIGRNGHQHVARFNEEIEGIDARAGQLFKNRTASASAWDQPLTEEDGQDERLAKAALSDSHARRLLNLRTWIRKCLAHGERIEDLVAHAQKYDQDEANLIREAAVGL